MLFFFFMRKLHVNPFLWFFFFYTYFWKTRLCFPCPILPSKLHCLFPCWSSNWYTPFLIFAFLLLFSFHLQSQLPLVGNPAPDFEAEAVFDQEFINVNITYWPEIYDQSYCTFICKENNLNAFFYCSSCCCCYYHLMSDFMMSLYLFFLSFFLSFFLLLFHYYLAKFIHHILLLIWKRKTNLILLFYVSDIHFILKLESWICFLFICVSI